MIASISGKKPHVYRVIILKQMADHRLFIPWYHFTTMIEHFVPWPHFTTVMEHFLPWYHFTTVMWLFIPWYHFTTMMEHFVPWPHFTPVMEHFLPWYHFTTVMWLFIPWYHFTAVIKLLYLDIILQPWCDFFYLDIILLPWCDIFYLDICLLLWWNILFLMISFYYGNRDCTFPTSISFCYRIMWLFPPRYHFTTGILYLDRILLPWGISTLISLNRDGTLFTLIIISLPCSAWRSIFILFLYDRGQNLTGGA